VNKRLGFIGALVTLVYLGSLSLLTHERWPKLLTMDLNAVGDFLAGAFGPIAIVWLVLGFIQQGEELKLNTEALKLQADELRQSVAQQRRLVELNNEEQAARREYAKPKFAVQGSQLLRNVERTLVQLDIQNHGATTTDVRVSLEPQCAWGDLLSEQVLREGDIRAQVLNFEADQPEIGEVRMSINFVDAAGVKGLAAFQIALAWGPDGVSVIVQRAIA
jgi:hypothetical protein